MLATTQIFWLSRAWKVAAQMPRPGWKKVAQIAANVAAALVVAVLIDRLCYRFLPQNLSSWIAPITQLWIFTSIFAFFCVRAVQSFEWVCTLVARLRARNS